MVILSKSFVSVPDIGQKIEGQGHHLKMILRTIQERGRKYNTNLETKLTKTDINLTKIKGRKDMVLLINMKKGRKREVKIGQGHGRILEKEIRTEI